MKKIALYSIYMASTFTQLVKIFTHRVCVRLASFHHRSPVAVETEISQKTRCRLYQPGVDCYMML